MAFQIQLIKQEDATELVELLSLVFNGWPKFDLKCTSLEHWKWKFVDNPPGRMNSIKAISDGRIVGCYHGVEMKLKIGDKLFLTNNGVDVAVHPDYRRMGIYKEMNNFRIKLRDKEGTKLGVWTSGNQIIIDHQVNPYSFVFPKPLSRLVRIRDIDLHLKNSPTDKKHFYKTGFRVIEAINRANNLLKPKPKFDKDIEISHIDRFDDKIDVFWEKVSKSYSYIVKRDQTYLNWRYCDPRGGEYHICVAEENDIILGFCVYRINKYQKKYPQAYIVDILTIPGRKDVRESLMNYMVDLLDKNDINIIRSITVRDTAIFKTMKKFRFIDSRMEQYVAVSPRGMTGDEAKKFHKDILSKRLHFVYGDFDTI